MLAGGAEAFAKPPAPKAPPPRVTPSPAPANISNGNNPRGVAIAPVRSAPKPVVVAKAPVRTIATTIAAKKPVPTPKAAGSASLAQKLLQVALTTKHNDITPDNIVPLQTAPISLPPWAARLPLDPSFSGTYMPSIEGINSAQLAQIMEQKAVGPQGGLEWAHPSVGGLSPYDTVPNRAIQVQTNGPLGNKTKGFMPTEQAPAKPRRLPIQV